ncbi:MAG TPA: serine protease, partial [Sediminibacterium sp.]|nr:serine protease [Sediminibacterium sp.]
MQPEALAYSILVGMLKKTCLLFCLLPLVIKAQTLSPEHRAQVRAATVSVLVAGHPQPGSGFFISASGEVLTAWQVVEPALRPDSAGGTFRLWPIEVMTGDGQKIAMTISPAFYRLHASDAIRYDYCVLSPVQPLQTPAVFFSLKKTGHLTEGMPVFATGRLEGNGPTPFIASGFLDQRFTDSAVFVANDGTRQSIYREAFLLQLPMQASMTGGPVFQAGKSIREDLVIGLANFSLSPYGHALQKIRDQYGPAE